jgi:hypothetical protein
MVRSAHQAEFLRAIADWEFLPQDARTPKVIMSWGRVSVGGWDTIRLDRDRSWHSFACKSYAELSTHFSEVAEGFSSAVCDDNRGWLSRALNERSKAPLRARRRGSS